ncbi:hypothetical protein Tco_0222288 [Tanacetum coccineum]
MQLIQDKSKESCMVSFQRLYSHLKRLSNNDLKGTRTENGFGCTFATLFGQDFEIFTGTMFLNMDQLQKQLDNDEFQKIGSMDSFKVLETQFQMFIKSKIYLNDEYIVMTRNYFLQYTQLDIPEFRETLHTEQPESNNEGEVDQNADQCYDTRPLPAKLTDNRTTELSNQILESENVCLKKTVAQYGFNGKIFTSSKTKVDSVNPNDSKEDITKPMVESEQALDVSADISENRASRNFDLMINIMMSDHNSSDLAPQRQEMSVENVSSGLVPQGQKASDYDNSDPVPPRKNVVPTAEKTNSSQQGLEFLFSPLLEDDYNPAYEIGESSSRNIDNTDVHSFQPQSHDYRWTRDHPLEQVRRNPTMPVQTRRQLATDPEMCMFALTVSIVEPKNIKEAMVDSAWIEAMQDELHQFDRLKV